MASKFKQEPTEFQLEVLALTLQEFRERTNICQIVREEAFEKKQLRLNDEKVDHFTEHYYKKLHHVHKWDACGLKDLKFLSEPPRDVPILEQTENPVKNSPFSVSTNSVWIHT